MYSKGREGKKEGNMRRWKNLVAVETIYEEDYEFSSSSSSLSPSPSSPPTPLHSRVQKW